MITIEVRRLSGNRIGSVMLVLAAATSITACNARTAASNTASTSELAKKTLADLIDVKGGEYQMGDFGVIHAPDKMQYSISVDDGPLHKVSVSDFSIMKKKVTLGDFRIFAAATGLPAPYKDNKDDPGMKAVLTHPRVAEIPVGVAWQTAKAYCHWLGKTVGKNMDLPTEAEWEYAARSRGQMTIFPTRTGNRAPGVDYPTREQTEKETGTPGGMMPGGMYPPNPLGLYDMAANGYEWTNDWYSDSYYAHSPTKDPRGPATGVARVVRGSTNGNTDPAMTFERYKEHPSIPEGGKFGTFLFHGIRCVARPTGSK